MTPTQSTPGITPDLEREFAEIAASVGCELLKAEFAGGSLKLVLDRPDGVVTLDDCQLVSKQVSSLLDVVDFGRSRYLLEVSSPGLDRELVADRDWERFVGSLVKVTWQDETAPSGATLVARLVEYRRGETGEAEGEALLVDPGTGRQARIRRGNIKRARLEPEL